MPTSDIQSPPATARKPGRPRRFDPDTVLDAALELFWKRGYSGTTTRDLEIQLGISQSSLYNEFGSKQALLESALDRYEEITRSAVLVELEIADDGLDAIERFFVALADWVTCDGRRGCMLINMMAEDGADDARITQRTRNYRQRVKTAIESQLQRAADLNQLRHPDAVQLNDKANLLIGMVLGFNIAARGGASTQELNSLISAVRTQLNGWRSPADRISN